MKKHSSQTRKQGADQSVVHLCHLGPAQTLLRAKDATSQAGFTSERIPPGFFARRPILIDDGPEHDEHRKQLVRFFSPKTLDTRHRAYIEETAAAYVARARASGSARIDEIALHYSVQVASRIVGLTESRVPALSKRLEGFFRQPPVDHTRSDHGRTQTDWMKAAWNALLPLLRFYHRDVKPAIKARRARPQDDIISHLLDHGYRPREILMECLTYGTAGMVTTREFISMTMLTLLSDAELRDRYERAQESERLAILNEIVRLEPPVAHIYRRVRAEGEGCPYSKGTLVDIDVRSANRDASVFTPHPDGICTERGLAASERLGLSFGDGAHRCPGSHLALLETDVLVRAFLHAGVHLVRAPDHGFDTLIQGYQLREFMVGFSSPEP